MKFIKTVEEGGTAPPFYGVAWRSFIKAEIYCAPIPLNHLIRVGRQVWHRLKYPKFFICSTVLLEQYHQASDGLRKLRREHRALKAKVERAESELQRQL